MKKQVLIMTLLVISINIQAKSNRENGKFLRSDRHTPIWHSEKNGFHYKEVQIVTPIISELLKISKNIQKKLINKQQKEKFKIVTVKIVSYILAVNNSDNLKTILKRISQIHTAVNEAKGELKLNKNENKKFLKKVKTFNTIFRELDIKKQK